ncbi:hypothetical protein D3C72_2071430 [compost metagenome]
MQQAPLAQRIAASRRFDLDHISAEVGEHLGRERAGDQLAKFNDPYAMQWLVHSHHPSHACCDEVMVGQSRKDENVGILHDPFQNGKGPIRSAQHWPHQGTARA